MDSAIAAAARVHTAHAIQSILHGPHTICLLTDFGILNSIACRILNSDQFLNWILTENELDSRVHIYFTEKVLRHCVRGSRELPVGPHGVVKVLGKSTYVGIFRAG